MILKKLRIIYSLMLDLPNLAKRYLSKRNDYHQITSSTNLNRYPEIFEAAVRSNNISEPKILSFGCSTGEECFSLRNYFPNSKIIGVDVNQSVLDIANSKNTDDKIIFYRFRDNKLWEDKYDIIFGLSVLCRWEETKYVRNSNSIYPFKTFKSMVEVLIDSLSEEGLLIIYNSNYFIEDVPKSKNLKSVSTPKITDSGFVTKFRPNGARSIDLHKTVVYRKKTT